MPVAKVKVRKNPKSVVKFLLQWRHAQGHWVDVTWGSTFNNSAETWHTQYQARRAARKMQANRAFCRNQKSRPKRFRIIKKIITTKVVEDIGS